MTDVVNMHEAKSRLSELVAKVERGEDVVIARAGRPAARLVRYEAPVDPRVPGRLAGRIEIAADFDETPIEVVEAFEDGR